MMADCEWIDASTGTSLAEGIVTLHNHETENPPLPKQPDAVA